MSAGKADRTRPALRTDASRAFVDGDGSDFRYQRPFLRRGVPFLVALVVADLAALVLAALFAAMLEHDTINLSVAWKQSADSRSSLAVSLPVFISAFAALRLYRYAWRFASLEVLRSVIIGCTIGTTAMGALQYGLAPDAPYSASRLVMCLLLGILLVGGLRIALRVANVSRVHGRQFMRVLREDRPSKRVLILGAGPPAAHLLMALLELDGEPYDVVGFLDDDPSTHGRYIRSTRVLGPLSFLPELIASDRLDEALVALTDLESASARECIMVCRENGLPVRIIPALQSLLDGKGHLTLENISMEDLLRRAPVTPDLPGIGRYLSGRRVMVTGAGGSIGSELCRQIASMGPDTLVLFGHGENSIDRIHRELRNTYPHIADRLAVAIGSVADRDRINETFKTHRPEVVFHAAAHKHVPIMETNVGEAVRNNVFGTMNVAEACGRYGAERIVLISTDKAVYPTSIMGATKWMCEEILHETSLRFTDTTFVTVRFGNVLGSRGSVVPLFREQIARGGPVTVTHPEMTRYFMTIPEAVQLVLQAGAVGQTGNLYLLDMGEPVRILDLAKDMIRLSGYVPEKQIPIAYTGLRPGEKLFEKLMMDDEEVVQTEWRGLRLVNRLERYTPEEMRDRVARLGALERAHKTREMIMFIAETVPSNGGETLLASMGLDAPDSWIRPLMVGPDDPELSDDITQTDGAPPSPRQSALT